VHAERDEIDPIEQAVIAFTQRFKIAEGETATPALSRGTHIKSVPR